MDAHGKVTGSRIYGHHWLFIRWYSANGSDLFRSAVRQEMEDRGIDPEKAQKAVCEVLDGDEGVSDLDELKQEYNSFEELINDR